jgi:hypothetical protein
MQHLQGVVDWLEEHAALSSLIAVGSIVFVIVSLWAVHRFLVTIPPDYFQHDHKRLDRWRDGHPALRYSVLFGKNALGAVLVLLGLVMIFTPGQGVLSILMGLSLLDIPGKRKFERKLIQQEGVLKVVNHLRARRSKPPLVF